MLEPPPPLVLLIDDNLTQLDLYTMMLEDDVAVVTATRGESGYALACSKQPAVIVIDMLLPDVDGLEICERLRANPVTESIPILLLTGDDHAYARAHRARSELTGVLLKPCSAGRLLAAIHDAQRRRET
jgi:CheY-like chemotaxis protein